MIKRKKTSIVRRKTVRVKKKRIIKRYPVGLEGIEEPKRKKKVKKVRKTRLVKRRVKSPAKRKIVMCLGSVPKPGVPEIKVRYNKSSKRFLGTVTHSKESSDFIRRLYKRGSIELQESFIVLYLNTRNEIIGYYKHADGGIDRATVDLRIILGTALKSLATGLLLAHNHPSGNTKPSQADIDLTKEVKDAAKVMHIRVLDHIIITKKDYTSFADEGLI